MKKADVVALVMWVLALSVLLALGIDWLHENVWHGRP